MAILIGTPHKKAAGYLCNDNRASGHGLKEDHIYVCEHCQKVLEAKDWKEDGGFCGRCMKPVCGPCADLMQTRGCEPYLKKIEQALELNARRAQFRRIAGV